VVRLLADLKVRRYGVTADVGGLVEVDRVTAVPYDIAPGLRHPRVDELAAGFEKALRADLRLAVTGILRRNANFVDSIGPDLRWRAPSP